MKVARHQQAPPNEVVAEAPAIQTTLSEEMEVPVLWQRAEPTQKKLTEVAEKPEPQ